MKHIIKIVVVLIGGLFLNSCTSNEEGINPATTQASHKVNINTSGFNIAEESMTRRTTENKLSDHISKLRYFVMESYGNTGGELALVKKIEQDYDVDNENFGSMTFDLENGEYTVFVIGEERNEREGYSAVNNPVPRVFLSFGHDLSSPIGDIFMSRQKIIVDNGDVTADFVLDRIVGQLEVRITDAIPVGTTHVDVILYNEVDHYYFDVDDLSPSRINLYSARVESEDIGSTTFSRKLFVLRSGGPVLNIEVRAYDGNGRVIASRIKDNVEIQRNKKTILTSSDFFKTPVDPSSSDVKVELNAAWVDMPAQEF